VLTEVERRRSIRNAYAVRAVVEKCVPVVKPELTIDVRKEDVWRTLEGVIYSCLQLMLTQDIIPVVLPLPGIHNALLR
jgi:hypothetical protein